MRVTTSYSRVGLIRCLPAVLAFMCFVTMSAWSMTDLYQLERSTGSRMDMSGSTQLFGPNESNVSSSLINIGFDFYFDTRRYTTFSVTSSGLMALGVRPYATYYPYYFPNSSTMSSSYPAIAGYWGRYFRPLTTTGKVHYKLSGTAPKRVLVVEWFDNSYSTTAHRGTYQVRLYEGSNKIEFYYHSMSYVSSTSTSYSAAIGIASSATRYINVYGNDFPTEVYTYPQGQYYTYYLQYSEPIANGTLYSFNPCDRQLALVGDMRQGGTDDMTNGDVLMENIQTLRGNSEVFAPFTISNPDNGCEAVSYSMSISGAGAGDYIVSNPNGVLNIGQSLTPTITFTPQNVGERQATLTIVMSNGDRYSFLLSATGMARIDWLGNVAEGGTNGMRDGDDLMTNIQVDRGDSRDFTPFTLRNFNMNGSAPLALISYTLNDPLGQYAIRLKAGDVAGPKTVSESIGADGRSTPIITFAPNANGTEYGTGYQDATLTVVADGETRVYTLNGFSVAPALEFFFEDGTRVLSSDGTQFRGIESCVGDMATTTRFDVENINRVPVVINAFDVYEMDSRVQQGTKRYPLAQDRSGRPVPVSDYFITTAPGVAPFRSNAHVKLPLTLGPGEKRSLYVTFIANRPGKRYARVFMNTNAVNFMGEPTDNFRAGATATSMKSGLLNMEFFARGLGSDLSGSADGSVQGIAITFNPVKVGTSAEQEVMMYNTGPCDLRIDKGDFRLTTGDVADFQLIEIMNGASLDAENNYVIPSGGSATVKARFTPSRSGSRRASVLVRTNDSTIYTEGVTERGIYYLDLYGVGKADLRVRDLALPPAVIDGPGSTGVLPIRNTSTEVIEITGLSLSGPSANQIMANPAKPWPTMPLKVLPEESVNLSVVFNAASGSAPGIRTATLKITYGSGETISSTLFGEAGTRTLVAAPPTLFDGILIPAGQVMRQVAVISNSGSFPVELSGITIEGDGAGDYQYLSSNRRRLDPGASEFVEVTYAPTAAGPSNATLVIRSNATNGVQTISLGAAASGTTVLGDPQGSTTRAQGEAASRAVSGMELSLANRPNPAISTSEIRYNLPGEGRLNLSIYDAQGMLVKTVVDDVQSAGMHTTKVNVEDLPSGTYVYVLRQGGNVVTRSMTVVK